MAKAGRLVLRVAIVLIAILVLLVGALAIFAASFDINRYKPEAIDWVKQNKNRTLAIDGPLSLSVFPRLELKLSGLKLSEHGKPDLFAEVDSAGLALELWPLLHKRLSIDRVSAQGVRLSWLRDAQGRSNIDDMLNKTPVPVAEPAPRAGPGMAFDVAGLQLRDVRLTVQDEQAKLRGSIEVAQLKTGRLAEGQDAPVELDLKLALSAPAVTGQLKGQTRVRFQLGQAGAAGLALQLGQLKAGFSGQAVGVSVAESSLSLDAAQWAPEQQRIQLEKLALQLKAQRDGKPIELSLDWPRLDVRGDTLEGAPLSGQVTLGGAAADLALKLRFASGQPTGSFSQIRLPALKLDVEAQRGGVAPLQAKGQLQTGLGLQTSPFMARLNDLQADLLLNLPGSGGLTVALKGEASASASQASWELDGHSKGPGHEGPVQSQGSVRLGGTAPVVTARLQLPALNLDQLRGTPAAVPASGPGAAGAPGGAPVADPPLDLSAAAAFHGTLDARVASLVANRIRFADVRLSLKGDGTTLSLSPFATQVWGGSLQGSAQVLPASQRLSLQAQASGVRIEQALKDLSGRDSVEGTGQLALDVQGAGKTLGQLKSSLAGKANVQLRDGAVKGINLAAVMRQAKAALALKQDDLQKAKTTEKTDFSEITASFDIANGVARNKDLNAKSPYLRVTGEGEIDIGRGSLNYTARTTVTDTAAGQGGQELAALKGVQVPVRFSGPFDAVQYQVQWSAVSTALAKEALRSKLGDQLRGSLGMPPRGTASAPADAASQPASNKDRLKNQLKGLFR